MMDSDAGGVLPWLGSIGYAATVLVGGGVVAYRTTLVDLLTIAPSEDHGPATPAVQAAAFSVIGLFFFASGASGLLTQLGLALFSSPHFGGATWQNTAGPLAELVVGLALFFGARGLRRLRGVTQALGRHLPPESDPDVTGGSHARTESSWSRRAKGPRN